MINRFMNYQRIYNELVAARLNTPPTGYTERHHILPKALGGSNDPTNLVVLSGRDHWVAHLLLHKIHRLPQTAAACHMMANGCKRRGISNVRASRMYESVRIDHANYMSTIAKQRTGIKNGSFGTRWICNIDLQENRKIKKDQPIPCGWIQGRNVWVKIANNKSKAAIALTESNARISTRLAAISHISVSSYRGTSKCAAVWGVSRIAARNFLNQHYVGKLYSRHA